MLKRFGIALLLASIAFLFFWQVGFFQYPLRWDALHCFLTWRHNVGESLRAGSLPLWSAYQYLGFPLHADPEVGAFYPPVWILGGLFGYDFYTLHIEWMFHVVIAGIGMYALSRSLGHSFYIRVIAAASFMASGMYVSNAQNFIYLIGISWFPLLIYYLRLLSHELKWSSVAALILIFYMMITGSYPGITIIAFYCLIVYGAYLFLYHWSSQGFSVLRYWGVLAGGTLVVCSAALYSVCQFLSYLSRADGLNASRILENPLPLKGYISFLLPWTAGTMENFQWGSDLTMINSYLGLIILVSVISFLFYKPRHRRQWWMLVSVVVLLLIALGEATPLRMAISHFPGLSLFRHPSIFRFFVLFLLVVLGAEQLHQSPKESWIKASIIAVIGIALLFCFHWTSFVPSSLSTLWAEWKNPVDHSAVSIWDRAILNGLLALFVLLTAALSIKYNRRIALVSIVIIDLFLATQVNITTMTVYTFPFDESQAKMEQLPQGKSPYAGEHLAFINSKRDSLRIPGIIENQNILQKMPAYDGYNSFILKGFDQFEKDPLFLSEMDHSLLYAKDSTSISHWQLNPNSISAEMAAGKATEVILLQNIHPNWTAKVNGQALNIEPYKGAMMKVSVPSCDQMRKIEFTYDSPLIRSLLYLSLLGLAVCLYLAIRPQKA